jgi:diketogulonate reductase-like aldo/keto reductase
LAAFDVGADARERDPLAEVLVTLFASGGSVIDRSPMYGRAETTVGDLLGAAGPRVKAFVATKVWTSGRAAGIAQMQRSAERMRAPRVDLMQNHNLLDRRTHLPVLRSWKADGRIRYLGITHYNPSAHDDLVTIMRAEELDFVQLDYALDDRVAERELLPLAADRGMAVPGEQAARQRQPHTPAARHAAARLRR